MDVTYDEQGGACANVAYVIGSVPEDAPEGTPAPVQTWMDSGFLARGEPRLESWTSLQSVVELTTLSERARTVVETSVEPAVTGTITRSVGASPGPGVIVPGDEVLVKSTRGAFGGGLTWVAVVDEVTESTTTQTLQVVGRGTLRGARPTKGRLIGRLTKRLTDAEAAIAARGRTVPEPTVSAVQVGDLLGIYNHDFRYGLDGWTYQSTGPTPPWSSLLSTELSGSALRLDGNFGGNLFQTYPRAVPTAPGQVWRLTARAWADGTGATLALRLLGLSADELSAAVETAAPIALTGGVQTITADITVPQPQDSFPWQRMVLGLLASRTVAGSPVVHVTDLTAQRIA